MTKPQYIPSAKRRECVDTTPPRSSYEHGEVAGMERAMAASEAERLLRAYRVLDKDFDRTMDAHEDHGHLIEREKALMAEIDAFLASPSTRSTERCRRDDVLEEAAKVCDQLAEALRPDCERAYTSDDDSDRLVPRNLNASACRGYSKGHAGDHCGNCGGRREDHRRHGE